MLNNKMRLLEKWKGIGEQMELGQNNDAKFSSLLPPAHMLISPISAISGNTIQNLYSLATCNIS